MPITPLLRNDPEIVEAISAALMDACTTLGLVDRTDQLTEALPDTSLDLPKGGVEGRLRGLLKTFVLVVGTGGRRFIRPTRQTSRGSPASLSGAIRSLLDALAAADAG